MRKLIVLITVGLGVLTACQKADQLDSLTNLKAKAIANVAGGTTYYIDPLGNDESSGTSTTAAWKSLAKVNASLFGPGDRILFKSGAVWNDTLHLKSSGSSDAPIVIDTYGGDTKAVINGGGQRNGSNALYLNQVSNFEVNNLELTNRVPTGKLYTATGIRINGGSNSSGVKIKNCYIHDVNSVTDVQMDRATFDANFNKANGGIIISGTVSNLLVQNCHIANSSVTGMRTTGTATNVIFDNNLLENIYGDGIIMAGATGGCKITHNTVHRACMNTSNYNFAGIWTVKSKNTLVAHNEVYGLTGGGINDGMAFDADGWDGPSTTDGDIFEYNYSHGNNGGFMLFMAASRNITVRYNVSVDDIGTSGKKKLFLFNGSTNRNHQIYNNVFHIKNPGGAIFHGTPYGTFSNNIFYFAAGTSNTLLAKNDNGQAIALTSQSSYNNNNFFPGTTFTGANIGTATAKDNFYTDPAFINPIGGQGFDAAKGYDLGANSPARNAGILIANNGSKDFLGNALPGGNPDVGAFQHSVIAQAGSSLADAFVRDGSYANTNYGTSADLLVKSDALSYARKSYVKFDIASVNKSKVSSARLKLYVAETNTALQRIINIYTTTNTSWLENTINWNNAPMDTVYAGQIVVTGVGLQTIDVTKAVNRQLMGTDRKLSFLLLNTGTFSSTGNVSFSSKEVAANKPLLELQY
ncbi:hypothetical protein BWD42_07770 [Sphingobacterium sp. CZ-UAM]|uniref:CBM96 family carbohydrate-binding protein n=1 Tax=Sphingobacterium sp. CZ-UAM TaxID=1933868 RepID=UPI000985FB49|nr:DNRLRE domain-containing protein [Sphingobacterium sp. CZ-UAM]OOG19786.1 hypothetical protein BWD42_07770 [Sphingobacterium sp. CZ-UAM]